MAQSHKFDLKKAVLQVRYKPNLNYYNQMYNYSELFSSYKDWETDRLRLTLRNYANKESFVIKHDSIGYETDTFKVSKINKASELIKTYVKDSGSETTITRLGYRTWALCPVSMEFQELKDILNMRLINSDFLKLNDADVEDLTVTVTGKKDGLDYRLMIGPMKNVEVPNFIQFNVDSHIDPNSIKKYTEIAEIYTSYPEVSLYMDLDIYKIIDKDSTATESEVEDFCNCSQILLESTSKSLLKHVFDTKI